MAIPLTDLFLHLDVYLQAAVKEYSGIIYLLLFLVIFMETGFVFIPFLPGDSLLFAIGAITAGGSLNILLVYIVILVAAILGDTVNYHIGKFAGPKVFRKDDSVLFNKKHLVRAQEFYEKHGGKTIILARFIPVIRSFAPFVAGIGKMKYVKFLAYNVVGGIFWSALFIFGGYFFGSIPFVQQNFTWIIIFIILVSLTPLIKELILHFVKKKKKESLNKNLEGGGERKR